jgi:hypothetical protein
MEKNDYYAYYDIPSQTDGIYYLLKGAIKKYSSKSTLLEVGSGPATRTIPFAKETGIKLHLLDPLKVPIRLLKRELNVTELLVQVLLEVC